MKCYGHPLSELSREYRPEEVSRRVSIERKYYILTTEGQVFKPEDYVFKPDEEDLKILVEKEVFKKELPGVSQDYSMFVGSSGLSGSQCLIAVI